MDDRQRVANGDRGIDGVAALLHHLDADFRREMMGRHHHAMLTFYRRRCRGESVRRLRRGQEDGETERNEFSACLRHDHLLPQ